MHIPLQVVDEGIAHQVIIVTLEGKKYLVDGGFGAQQPREPVLLTEDSIERWNKGKGAFAICAAEVIFHCSITILLPLAGLHVFQPILSRGQLRDRKAGPWVLLLFVLSELATLNQSVVGIWARAAKQRLHTLSPKPCIL